MIQYIKTKIDQTTTESKKRKIQYFKNSCDAYNTYLISNHFSVKNETIFVVLANLYEAQKYYDLLTQINDANDCLFYPADQTLTSIMALGSPEFKSERIYTLKQLMTNKPHIVVTTLQGICQRQLTPIDYERAVKILIRNEVYDMTDLVQFLIYGGYVRTHTVEKPGEFSVRGHIIDVFTLNHDQPYRLDFFDQILDQIKIFDVETQRSHGNIEKVEIAPMHELFFTDQMKRDAMTNIEKFFSNKNLSQRELEKLNHDIESLSMRQRIDGLSIYIPFFNKEETTLLNFSSNYFIYMIDVHKMKTNELSTESDLDTYATTMNGRAFLDIPFRLPLKNILSLPHLEIDNYGLNSKADAVDLGASATNIYQGNLNMLSLDLKDTINTYQIIISVPTTTYFNELISHLNDKNLPYREDQPQDIGIFVTREDVHASFIAKNEKLLCIEEGHLFASKTRQAIRYRSVLNQATKIRHIEDLNIGDYIVHYDYGIGQYVGLKTMELSQEKRDYLHIIYANEEALYVPMDQMDLVLKYSSHDGIKPKLSKLGGKQWSKTKTAVRMRIKDLSDRLLQLYAQRQQSLGYAYHKDTEMQKLFELDFPYQTTKDQERTIIETKYDMESERPMDRLICGDVGFGKTEVALRAAFKAVLDAKQVFYLVPTTVLARQHYYTFKERFDKYGANVALLSRFVKTKQQKETLDKLKKGYIDVLIGTHRLLSKDVVFKDLGLLIIDEEQRFGVEHKERIREIKTNIDTLTLSATPIPRTLQMSMMGLKDLSMIETPPLNRYPVQTYVVERHQALIKEAISRELARGGQVFYLFNRIQGIELMVHRLKTLVPEAKIAYAHGQMHRDALENVLSDFIEHRYDVLVSTTIIETGVDIPNTNTLIIHEADKLGLAQLYQIRGRVGRSDRIAYAYLLYEQGKIMNDEAKKRLTAIQDFTALGSGYKIALRDLSIRGAGDLLGQEQSGFIDSVGIELYMKLLQEVITGEQIEKPKETTPDEVYAARHVDPNYANHDTLRIEIHRRIANINRLQDVSNLKDEFKDRFGDLDADLLLYMYEKLFKKLSAKVGVQKTIREQVLITLVLSIEASQNIDGKKLFEKANEFKPTIRLNYFKGHVHIAMPIKNEKQHWLYLFSRFLDDYIYGA